MESATLSTTTIHRKTMSLSEEDRKFYKKQKINYLAEEHINKSSQNLLFEKMRKNDNFLERLKEKLQNITTNIIPSDDIHSDRIETKPIEISKKNIASYKTTEMDEKDKTNGNYKSFFLNGKNKEINDKLQISINNEERTTNITEDYYEEIIKFVVTPEKQTDKPDNPQKETIRKHSKTKSSWVSETTKKNIQNKINSPFKKEKPKKIIIGKQSIYTKSPNIRKNNPPKNLNNQLKKSSWEWQQDRKNHICKVLFEIDRKYTFLKNQID